MKQCPQCRTTYTDDTLKFCLADGTLLSDLGEEETHVRPGVRVEIEPPRTVAGTNVPAGKTSGFPILKVLIALLVLGFLGLLAAGGAGVLFYMKSGENSAMVAQSTATPTPRPTAEPSATPDADTDQERLEKEIAKALKKLEEELGTNENRPAPTPSKDDNADGRPTARVNSPGDGFLALRDEPDVETGERLAKIPHGAVISLENCEKQRTTVSGRTGRWCMVTYQGETGWVFDAWLLYDQ